MAKAPQIQLPRNYYKKLTPPPEIRLQSKTYQANLMADFGSIGPGRNASINEFRNMLLQDFAKSIVDQTRALHINKTMEGWKELRAQDQLNEEVAIIVDGSPQRPIKNVKFAGNIRIMAPPGVETIIAAVKLAWLTMIYQAQRMTVAPDYLEKKNNNFSYKNSFSIWINEETNLSDVSDLDKPGVVKPNDFITIYNAVPYAAKLERRNYPNGLFVQAFKKVRSKYGNQVAVRFDYIASDKYTMRQSGGTPVPQPVLRIGSAGAFPSRSAKNNVAKSRRRNQKAGRLY